MLLLALLLFCAAASIQWSQVRDLIARPGTLLLALVPIWIGPAIIVAMLGAALPHLLPSAQTVGILVGLALVASMPVANSSAGWTQNAGGNVALSLGLIVVSIILCPLATPNMLKLMGLALSSDETAKIEQFVAQFTGGQFMAWVILPSLAGGAAAALAGGDRIANAKPLLRLISLVDILVLNYANASVAVRKIWEQETGFALVAAAALTAAGSLMGVLMAILLARICRLGSESRVAMMFGLSMKHTGLGLVLAGQVTALRDEPRVILVILLATLMQHIVAAGLDRRLQRLSSGD
jgi:BASS family bile acid:Na+ symporter